MRSPGPEFTITPTPPPAETAYRLVFQESGATEDKIWRISPKEPGNREEVATIPHREGWSVKASLSPDNRFVAYIRLPQSGTDPAYHSELYVLDLKLKETAFIERNVDQTVSAAVVAGQPVVVSQAIRRAGGGDRPGDGATQAGAGRSPANA